MNSQTTLDEVNSAIRGFTILRRLEFAANEDLSDYTLLLELVDRPRPPYTSVSVQFYGVSELVAKDLGGGLTQLLFLKVQDISELQIDRARFRVDELERNSLLFVCESLRLLPSSKEV